MPHRSVRDVIANQKSFTAPGNTTIATGGLADVVVPHTHAIDAWVPLFLFSGTFYPISQLPGALQVLAHFSPLYHAVQLARAATTGTFDLGPDLVSLGVLVGCILAGLAWGRRRFERRLAA